VPDEDELLEEELELLDEDDDELEPLEDDELELLEDEELELPLDDELLDDDELELLPFWSVTTPAAETVTAKVPWAVVVSVPPGTNCNVSVPLAGVAVAK